LVEYEKENKKTISEYKKDAIQYVNTGTWNLQEGTK